MTPDVIMRVVEFELPESTLERGGGEFTERGAEISEGGGPGTLEGLGD